ncbi:hypothetical protein GBAR_LOCUS30363 [Geodia barretti]|uniref:Uncharacterized protein n=1 Tax=Geodia barretti TaxID=519541 RepID=A0AA35XFL6_GEOBA|nr:hypothetical protein GBAR_LOCUS30363 [Geodia barretti]
MQYIVSRQRVLQYCTKYVTKSEPRSQSLKEISTVLDGQQTEQGYPSNVSYMTGKKNSHFYVEGSL